MRNLTLTALLLGTMTLPAFAQTAHPGSTNARPISNAASIRA